HGSGCPPILVSQRPGTAPGSRSGGRPLGHGRGGRRATQLCAAGRHPTRPIEGDLMINRRHALALGLAVPGAAALASCGPNAGGGGAEEGSGSAAIRLAWSGNPTRDELTEQRVEADAEVRASVRSSTEPRGGNGAWDKLATQTAGGDLRDVIQMDEKYISEYGGRGALLDLAEAGLDTSDFAEGAVEVGELADEGLMAINAGLNAAVFLVNPAVFE